MTISRTTKFTAAAVAAAGIAAGVLAAPTASAGNLSDTWIGPLYIGLDCRDGVLRNESSFGMLPILNQPILTLDGLC